MSRWGRSLTFRLLAAALIGTTLALLFAAMVVGGVLERFVVHGMDERLDTQLGILVGALTPDGGLDRQRVVDLPGFGVRNSGWVWQVRVADGRTWRSEVGGSLRDVDAPAPPVAIGSLATGDGIAPGEGVGVDGRRLHLRILRVLTPAGPVTITAGGPRRTIDAPLAEAERPLLLCLSALGFGLAASTVVQLRWGLRPLRLLPDEIAAVMAGRREKLTEDGIRETEALARAVNALIEANGVGLENARRHVANLAHGLKTPLARITLGLEEQGRDPDGRLREMLHDADRRIAHHLRRARAAAPGGAGRALTVLAPVLHDLAEVLRRLHADRAVTLALDLPSDIRVAVDRQDLEEMAGNLLENACQYAAGRVTIGVECAAGSVAVVVRDDGPGLDAAALEAAPIPGKRLDETKQGFGFGLAITRELAELWGGALQLGNDAPAGGLVARLVLPAASGDRT